MIDYTALLIAVQRPGIFRATKYISPALVVKATRQRYKGKLLTRSARQETILVTIGKPNWRERRFIRQCQQAEEPFPIRKIQLKHVSGA
mgnify:CR=1 FL=1